MLTLEEAQKNWAETGRHGTREERIARGRKWLPYYAFLAKKQENAPYSLPTAPSPFVAALIDCGAVKPGDTLLDIGAGMGNYALEFAAAGCRVTAMDASRECLDVLAHRAEQCGLQIDTLQCTWEEYTDARHFDVTFSSMCPAICSMEELERMETITDRTCVLITVARGSYDKHRKAMMKALDIHPNGGMTTEALHYMNILYLTGRQFQMMSHSTQSSFRVSAETVMQQYPIYFRIFGIPESVSIPFLEEYLDKNSVDGFLEDESRMNLAMLHWKVHPRTVL